MPKFAKTCNNPLHSEFSEGLEGSTIVNLKAFGLLQFAEALAIFLPCEKQIKTTKKIRQLCKNCICKCCKKRNFTRNLDKRLSIKVIERKVGKKYFPEIFFPENTFFHIIDGTIHFLVKTNKVCCSLMF